jgi:hypothetical protein
VERDGNGRQLDMPEVEHFHGRGRRSGLQNLPSIDKALSVDRNSEENLKKFAVSEEYDGEEWRHRELAMRCGARGSSCDMGEPKRGLYPPNGCTNCRICDYRRGPTKGARRRGGREAPPVL